MEEGSLFRTVDGADASLLFHGLGPPLLPLLLHVITCLLSLSLARSRSRSRSLTHARTHTHARARAQGLKLDAIKPKMKGEKRTKKGFLKGYKDLNVDSY